MRRVTSLLLILLSVPINIFLFLGFTIQNSVLSADFVIDGLSEIGVYAAPFDLSLGEEIAQNIANRDEGEVSDEDMAVDAASIDPILISSAIQNIQQSLATEFGPAYLESKTEPLVQNFYSWVLGNTDDLKLIVKVESDLVDRVISVFQSTATVALQNLPECAPEQEFSEQEVILCIPPGTTQEQLMPIIETYTERLDAVARDVIPTELDLAPRLKESGQYSQLLLAREYVLIGRHVLQWMVVYEFVILLLLVWINRQYIYTRWAGMALIVSFFIPLVIAGIIRFAGETFLASTLLVELQSNSDLPIIAKNIIQNTSFYLVNTVGSIMILLSGIPFFLGILLLSIPKRLIQRTSEIPVNSKVADSA